MIIRHATTNDICDIACVEALCFPKEEAASSKSIADRVNAFPNNFWLGYDNGTLVSYVDGLVTDMQDLSDDMFEDAKLHNDNGAWQMLFSVCTHPEHQDKGLASNVLRKVISDCKQSQRKGVVLTCKEALLPFYARFGFVNEGVSKSEHGGALWYQMRLAF